jgi:hypothetical protein
MNVTLFVIQMLILISFHHFRGPSTTGFMLTAIELVERKPDHD